MVQKMPIPTRSAPRPPGNYGTQNNNAAWSNKDPFDVPSTMQPVQKKKPPPRPPPPRFGKYYAAKQDEREKKQAVRPTELLGNMFGRRQQQKPENTRSTYSVSRPPPSNSRTFVNPTDPGVSLIDLSPPGSPTFTTRSSSDGVSVDSFGSDGNSNPSVFTSSGNTSQTESAFEDDFNFFGSLGSNPRVATNDPWNLNVSKNPFLPLPSNGNTSNSTMRYGDACFFAHNEASEASTSRPGFDVSTTNVAMPTIIRARPPKPPPPKGVNRGLAPIVVDFNATATSSTFAKINNVPTSGSNARYAVTNEWQPNFDENPSPPMPSMPPPAPPSKFFPEIHDNAKSIRTIDGPHGLALYDFEASQPGDLQLNRGDVVVLVRTVNDEWLEGRVGDRSGIFPSNFVDVVVPLPGSSVNIVNAIYTFTGTTWDDLPFQEGDRITVLSRISDDWLYGECEGKKGQFPANYVDRIPHDLPKYS